MIQDIEKGHRHFRRFPMLTYFLYAPRVKVPAALPVEKVLLGEIKFGRVK